MKNTKIEWCDHTFNPWIGCTMVSPGCAHCYASVSTPVRTMGIKWGAGQPRHRTSASTWAQPIKWNREAEAEYLQLAHRTGAGEVIRFTRPRVFCASLSDWLDDEVPVEWLADLIGLVRVCKHLDFLMLTKRPQNWRSRLEAAFEDAARQDSEKLAAFIALWLAGGVPPNVWIGTTVEDQTRADQRIPHLIEIPARVRFLSCEPLLGPVEIEDYLEDQLDGGYVLGSSPIHWVICGGESGHDARPMHPDWARSLRDQCAAAGVPFLFKQWGEWKPGTARLKRWNPESPDDYVNEVRWASDGKTVGITEHTRQQNLTTPSRPPHSFEDGEILTYRVGKKAAGRLLAGVQHDGFPEVQS